MAKVLCVLYDDPIDGMPQSYARNDIPKLDRYPDGQTLPTPEGIDFKPGEILGCVSGELGLRSYLERNGHTLVVTEDKDGPDSEFERELVDADVVISQPFWPAYLTADRIAKAKNLKLALTAGIGSDHGAPGDNRNPIPVACLLRPAKRQDELVAGPRSPRPAVVEHRAMFKEDYRIMMPPPAAQDRPLVRWRRQPGFGQHFGDCRIILILELTGIGGDAIRDQPLKHIVDFEQFRDESPTPIEAIGHAPRAFLGPVAQPDSPVCGQLAVIGDFLGALGRDRGKAFVS